MQVVDLYQTYTDAAVLAGDDGSVLAGELCSITELFTQDLIG